MWLALNFPNHFLGYAILFHTNPKRRNHIHRTKKEQKSMKKHRKQMREVMKLPCECSMRTYTCCCFIHTASAGTGWIHLCVGMNPLYVRILHSLEFLMSLLKWHWYLHSNLCFILALNMPRNIYSINLDRGQCGRIDCAILSDSVSKKRKKEKKNLRRWLVGFWIFRIVLVVFNL